MIETIALDADDTLWHNEVHYSLSQDKFAALLAPYCAAKAVENKLYETEMRNLRLFGYGTKGFVLSMIETAIELSDGRIGGAEIRQIIDSGKAMLNADIQLLPHVQETLATLCASYKLMIITKGDLFDQESKIARSGLAHYFQHIEIVSDKSQPTYKNLLAKYGIKPQHFLMAGNSLKSDVLPVIAIGAKAAHVPYQITWAHETAPDLDPVKKEYYELEHLGQLPDLVKSL